MDVNTDKRALDIAPLLRQLSGLAKQGSVSADEKLQLKQLLLSNEEAKVSLVQELLVPLAATSPTPVVAAGNPAKRASGSAAAGERKRSSPNRRENHCLALQVNCDEL